MINALRLIRSVGQFDLVTGGERLPLDRLTVLFAENGRGKTTISAIIRSLANGDPVPIAERRRLAANNAPQVIIECVGGPPAYAMFENNAWTRTLPRVAIFDDSFVNANVYSGLVVDSAHRQRLHELILGAGGVRLNAQLQAHVARIEEHNREVRQCMAAIPDGARAGLSHDDFCALQARPNIDEDVRAAEQRLEAARQRDVIRRTNSLPIPSLPTFDLASLDGVLRRDLPALDAEAAARVNAHIAELGDGSHDWLSQGTQFVAVDPESPCPFCAQPLTGSPLIAHYRAYFSQQYSALRHDIGGARDALSRQHGDAVMLEFERATRTAQERRQFWMQFTQVPPIELDTDALGRSWREARQAASDLLQAKLADPLARIEASDETRRVIHAYDEQRAIVSAMGERLAVANREIDRVKREAAEGDTLVLARELAMVNAAKARHSADVSPLCAAYLTAKAVKIVTEQARDANKAALERHRREVFPVYQGAINRYLERFNAGFRIEQVEPLDNRGGPTCTYSVAINNVRVPVGGDEPGQPSFRTTLSSGDRNALALAFFFASLDQDPELREKIVVIDDPVSSLDAHRTDTTVQEIRTLSRRAAQVIVLSHNKNFLCAIWNGADRIARTALEVAREGAGSTLRAWNVDAASETEQDRRHARLRDFLDQNRGNARDVATDLRPTLEAFVRVAYPEHFPAGSLLGPFVNKCEQRLGASDLPILERAATDELRQLLEYANQFHHDNPAYNEEAINDQQLLGYVQRTLRFARK